MSIINFGIKCPDDFVPIGDEILEKTIIPQFEMIVEKYPNKTAITSSIHRITYRELNNAINNLSYQIIDLMGEDKSPVAFLLNDEVFSVITFMAVLKTGRMYVGLHPSNSEEQIKGYIKDSTTSLLITTKDFKEVVENSIKECQSIKLFYLDRIQTEINSPNPKVHSQFNDIFGIFYTSGSTGKPKGISQGHLYKSQSAMYMTNEWFVSPSDRISLVTSVCYSASYPSIMCALLNGGTLCIFDIKSSSAQKVMDWIVSENLTIFRSTPSIFRSVFGNAPNGLVFTTLRFMTLGGEPVSDSDIELFKAHTADDCVLINNFSASESGTICHYPVNHNTPAFTGFLPAGFPAPGKEVILLDEDGREVENGAVGEIIVRSQFLSLGYWGKPELTAQKFFTDPNNPKIRIYHTGDRGFWQKDGALVTIGREDSQVKIRGFRVQLEAIDLALRKLENVKDAATIVHKSSGNGQKIIAYLSLHDPKDFSTSKMKQALALKLPDYMIPSLFIQLDTLPRTPTGKLARLELPDPSNKRPNLETPYLPPSNELEDKIASIWQENLGMDQIGINDNFFELGGDSLSALVMTLEVEKLTLRPVPQSFFKNPTISTLTKILESDSQKTTLNNKFTLESFNKSSRSNKKGIIKKLTKRNINRLTSRILSFSISEKLDRVIDLIVARQIVMRPYFDANKWIVSWCQNVWVRNTLYNTRYKLFSRWVASLKDCSVDPSEAFQMNMMTNMLSGTTRYLGKLKLTHKTDLQAYKSSKYPYLRTFGELLDAIPSGTLNDDFPMVGTEYLSEAHRKGKGIILLAFHGTPTSHRFFALERFLNLDSIPTISYQIPVRQSQYRNNKAEMSEEVVSTLNSEMAFYAQKLLQEGKVINIPGDASDKHGKRYKVNLGGREYLIKAGFAELSLNTGAAIIPYYRCCLPDGRVQLNFGKPLDAGIGEREDKVERLINGYCAYINHIWSTRPEVIRWNRMKKHFSQKAIQK